MLPGYAGLGLLLKHAVLKATSLSAVWEHGGIANPEHSKSGLGRSHQQLMRYKGTVGFMPLRPGSKANACDSLASSMGLVGGSLYCWAVPFFIASCNDSAYKPLRNFRGFAVWRLFDLSWRLVIHSNVD